MTCIIGLAVEDAVYLAADSAGSDGWVTRHVTTSKLVRRGDFLFGYTGSFRMGQILQYHLAIPEKQEGEADRAYVSRIVEAIRLRFKELGFTSIESSVERGGDFLVTYANRLYTVQGDFSFIEHADGFDAIGAGCMAALGALVALDHLPPTQRLTRALEVVSKLQPGSVLPPFVVEEGTP